MKKLLFLLFFIPLIGFSQNFIEKYNSLQGRYERYNSSGQMIGYRTYNSLMEQWEYTDLSSNNTTQYGIVHDYGEPQSTFDSDLAYRALAAKQQRYNNLSPQQKAQLSWAREYNRKKQFVDYKSYKPIKKVIKCGQKTNKKQKKETRQNYKDIQGENRYSIKYLKDGWYNAYSEGNNVLFKRKLFINNGKITKYLNGNNMLVNIEKVSEKYNNNYELTLSLRNQHFNSTVFITDDKKIKEPKIEPSSQLMFYTNSQNINGYINVIVKMGNQYYSLNQIKYYLNEAPDCSQSEHLSSTILPPGTCTYYAFSETEYWTDKIEIKPNDCLKINLTKN